MASRFVNSDAQRSLKRINAEISIDAEDKKDFVNIAKAHFAAGNAGDAVTVIAALGRLDEKIDVTEQIAQQNAVDRKSLLKEIDARLGNKPAETPSVPLDLKILLEKMNNRLIDLEKQMKP